MQWYTHQKNETRLIFMRSTMKQSTKNLLARTFRKFPSAIKSNSEATIVFSSNNCIYLIIAHPRLN